MKPMLSLKLIRENPEILANSLKRRNLESAPANELIALDKRWRAAKTESDKQKSEKNTLSLLISEAKKKGDDTSKIVEKTRELA